MHIRSVTLPKLNSAIMDKYAPQLEKFYYDSSKYGTYMEQLGIKYPTVRSATQGSVTAPDLPPTELEDTIVAATARSTPKPGN